MMENAFQSPLLREAAEVVLTNPYYDGLVHHGELSFRYREDSGCHPLVADVAATIQSGYWPNWMVDLDAATTRELMDHVSGVNELPAFGTTLFGGWYYPW